MLCVFTFEPRNGAIIEPYIFVSNMIHIFYRSSLGIGSHKIFHQEASVSQASAARYAITEVRKHKNTPVKSQDDDVT